MPDKTKSGASAFRPTYASRPNKTAAGMMKTSSLQGERKRFVSRDNPWYPFADEHDAIVNRLLVHGTTDTMGRGRIHIVTTRGGILALVVGLPLKNTA